MRFILTLIAVLIAFTTVSIAKADPKFERAWLVYEVNDTPGSTPHFKLWDFFTIKQSGSKKLKILPGLKMENRGWGHDGYEANKTEDGDFYCLYMDDDMHKRSGTPGAHWFVFYLDPVVENEMIIRYGSDDLADTCKELANHGGLAHAEGSR